MSIDLVELGQSIGEAQATAEAALETAQIAEVEATLAVAEDSPDASLESEATAHCGPDCPCHQKQTELEAMLVAFADKHDEDMDTIARALDYLLGEELEVEEEGGVEVINPEEEEERGSESTEHQSSAEGHGTAGASSEQAASAEEAEKPRQEHKRPAGASRIRFRRGRR